MLKCFVLHLEYGRPKCVCVSCKSSLLYVYFFTQYRALWLFYSIQMLHFGYWQPLNWLPVQSFKIYIWKHLFNSITERSPRCQQWADNVSTRFTLFQIKVLSRHVDFNINTADDVHEEQSGAGDLIQYPDWNIYAGCIAKVLIVSLQ